MSTPSKKRSDLWAEFQQQSGADKHVVSARSLTIAFVVVLLIVAAFLLG